MRVVVPYAASEPKTRLADVLSADERAEFAAAMLDDVLAAIRATGHEPEILATEPVAVDAQVTVDQRPLTDAVNAVLADAGENASVGVVMADLALVTPDALERLFAADGEVVLAPGRGGGTNALVARHPEFRVDYHGTSYLDHLEIAREVGTEVEVVDSHRLATDVDEREDLAEVLIHGGSADWDGGREDRDGRRVNRDDDRGTEPNSRETGSDPRETSRARAWLRRAGFGLTAADGRTPVSRESATGDHS